MPSSKPQCNRSLGQGFYLLLAACCLLLLTSCGFHLRGSEITRVQLPPVYIAGNAGALQREVLRYLAISEVSVVEDKKDAQLVIDLIGEDVRRRVLSVGATGKVQEYEVHYTVTYAVHRGDGTVVISRETLDQQRDYTFNESEVLAKDQEQEKLVQDMRRDVVRQMMLRIQAAFGGIP